MNAQEIQAIRTTGRVMGGFSMVCGLITMYALSRLLTSPTNGNKHHPKLTGTHSYFTLLLVSSAGDCLNAMGHSVFSLALPLNTNHTTSTNVHVPGADICVAQGFVLELSSAISVVFSSLGAIEMYNIRPQLTHTQYHWQQQRRLTLSVPGWQRRLTSLLLAGFSVVVVQVSLAGGLYGYGHEAPGSAPWCWVNISTATEAFVSMYALAFLSIFIIIGSTVAYLRHIHTKLLRRSVGDVRRARRTFAKLSVFPCIYLVAWTPAFVNRLLVPFVKYTADDKFLFLTLFVVFLSSLGTLNFLFLSCMNRQVRKFLPGWRYCCAAANQIDEDGGTRTTRSDSRLEIAMKVWDSSSDEEEEGGEVEVINPVMEMQNLRVQ